MYFCENRKFRNFYSLLFVIIVCYDSSHILIYCSSKIKKKKQGKVDFFRFEVCFWWYKKWKIKAISVLINSSFFHFISLTLIPNIIFFVYQSILNYKVSLSMQLIAFIVMESHFHYRYLMIESILILSRYLVKNSDSRHFDLN